MLLDLGLVWSKSGLEDILSQSGDKCAGIFSMSLGGGFGLPVSFGSSTATVGTVSSSDSPSLMVSEVFSAIIMDGA